MEKANVVHFIQLYVLFMCHLQYDDLENSLRDSGVLAQTQKTEHLEVTQRQKKEKKKGGGGGERKIEISRKKNQSVKPQTSAQCLAKSQILIT